MKNKVVDVIIVLACFAGLIISFCPFEVDKSGLIDTVCYILGSIGLFYCAHYLFLWICNPIKRDWILVRGHFVWKVVCFVLLMPFLITSAVLHKQDRDDGSGFATDVSYRSFKKDLVWGEYLYKDTVAPPNPVDSEQKEPHLFWSVYYHFIDPGNQHMASSQAGRGWTALTAILGLLLLNGLLISTLINYFDRRKERWQNGEVRYGCCSLGKNKFAVVIGMHNIAPTIIRELLEGKGETSKLRYVILLVDENAQEARERVESYLTEKQKRKLIVYSGQLDSMEVIYGLQFKHVAEIYVLGKEKADDVSNSYHDTQNMRIVHNIASYLTDKCVYRKKICRVLFEYQTIYSVFQFSDLNQAIKDHLVFIPFNTYEDWAQRVLVYGKYKEARNNVLCIPQQEALKNTWWNRLMYKTILAMQGRLKKSHTHPFEIIYQPLDGNGITSETEQYVHFVVVGMSKMGVAMALQAVQIAHYPNFEDEKRINKLRTRITFIDENADKEMNFFKGHYQNMFDLARHRYLDATVEENAFILDPDWIDLIKLRDSPYHYLGNNFIDIEWEFVKGTVDMPNVAQYLKHSAEQAKNKKSIFTVAICLPCSNEALASALYMPSMVYDYANDIWVYQREAGDIVYNLMENNDRNENKRYGKLRPFGMEYANFTMASKNIYHRAQLCGYVYDLCFCNKIYNESIPDIIEKIASSANKVEMKPARELWKTTAIFNKWSNMYLANSFETKLRSAGCPTQKYDDNYQCNRSHLEDKMFIYSKCEHDRWNVQQLLMGFRAYTEAENNEYGTLKKNKDNSAEALQAYKDYKNEKKTGFAKAHLNICPFARLDEVDNSVKAYDEAFIRSIPAILKVVEAGKEETDSKQN